MFGGANDDHIDRPQKGGLNMATDAGANAQVGGAGDRTGGSSSGAAPPAGGSQPTPGAYELAKGLEPGEEFNLRLTEDHAHPVPADQAKLSKDVYETRNILKLLRSEGRLGTKTESDGTYDKFIIRVKEAARAGCIGKNVETTLAADALTQIRADILRRIGRPLAFRYLCFLGLWGLGGALIGLGMAAAGYWTSVVLFQSIGPYGWVLVGAMAGAWFGVAVRRWQIAFEELPGFLDVNYEPLIRVVFVTVVASVLALFLHLGVLNITLGSVDLAGFVGGKLPVETALLLGFIAGMSERAVSKQLVEQVGKSLPQS
jgi:hypothetical protein